MIKIVRESVPVPEWAQAKLVEAGGRNPLGAAMYRFVWGQDRREFVGGKWTDRDENTGVVLREVIEQRFVPKYSHLGADHFFVERWYPPENYGSRKAWELLTLEREDGITIAARGPYPAQGDYEHFYTMEGPNGEFRQLTFGRVQWIAEIVKDTELASAAQRWAAKQAAKAQAETEQDVLDREVLNEATPAFKGKMRRGTAVTVL